MSEVITVAVVVLSRFPRISTHTSTLPFSSGTKICASTNPISAAVWQTRCTMVTKRVNWVAHNLKVTTSWCVFTASRKETITGLLQKNLTNRNSFLRMPFKLSWEAPPKPAYLCLLKYPCMSHRHSVTCTTVCSIEILETACMWCHPPCYPPCPPPFQPKADT